MSAYKKFPPFGRMLFELRQTGKISAQTVMIVFDWNTAITYPRIVLASNISPDTLQFDYLAGLPVQIIFRDKDAHRVNSVVQEIIKVNPSFLSTFALDLVDEGVAPTLIRSYKEAIRKEYVFKTIDETPEARTVLSGVQIICAVDIKPGTISWLWNGWLARGKFHIFAGQAGIGKTTIAITLAAIVSTGGYFPEYGAEADLSSISEIDLWRFLSSPITSCKWLNHGTYTLRNQRAA